MTVHTHIHTKQRTTVSISINFTSFPSIFTLHQSSFKMRFAIQAVSLLLLAPSLIAAAPAGGPGDDVAIGEDFNDFGDIEFTKREEEADLFARQQTCNPTHPTQELQDKMAQATAAAHRGQSACKSTDRVTFQKSKNKDNRTKIKKACLDGYTQYVTAAYNA
jgi:hypothetical protein